MSRTYRRIKNVSMPRRRARFLADFAGPTYLKWNRAEWMAETIVRTEQEIKLLTNYYHSDRMPPNDRTGSELSNQEERTHWKREQQRYLNDPDHEIILSRVHQNLWWYVLD